MELQSINNLINDSEISRKCVTPAVGVGFFSKIKKFTCRRCRKISNVDSYSVVAVTENPATD